MGNISRTITAFLAEHFQSEAGINATLAVLRADNSESPHDIRVFTIRNVAADLLEKSNQALYPCVLIYCEKLSNTLAEKFRDFSGVARFSVEVRNSADRLEALDSSLVYSDVICTVLTGMRGEWLTGVSYNGGYEVAYSAVREGGKHFIQSTKVSFEVNVSE